ncbi:hypothetical protein, conserved [Entamoeba dispar SAW760]|uniref:Leucine rich repeat containing protein BspA family protein n=1 Tax=Entamoeba dispar (strain ATCC PRA-260 / SAW760) TaxID=370354 RepID=B0EGG6_ENTDS|nr:uncharacterized protein EDI_239780 [Entamoeba dispar SAW760]EDR26382.1 hypothetical protein, conserved [Entamoeba dispar SAW760]|eukprot:EDR26382.1 hypothetical protein, conserved [Entamoeba dispar SAW760]
MKLGYNEIMITSMYFNDINDFINLELGVKRFQGNMERFHFNPIPLNEHSRKLFPNIETFHIYSKNDEIFNDGKIFKKVMWCTVDYSTYLKEKEQGNSCKNIEYTYKDRNKYGNIIPQEVKSLGNECFYECSSLTSINIPSSISKLGDLCFRKCSLTTINVPTTVSVLGNECFCECSSLTSVTIPTTISKLGDECFSGCSSLTSVTIPTTVSELGRCCFDECTSLTSIVLENIQFISEERIFMNKPVLISFKIPKNLQKINGENIEKKDINEFIIPTTITKLGDWCFSGCLSLTSVDIPTTISELGGCCFCVCPSLTSINIPTTIKEFGYWCFYKCYSLTSISIPPSVNKIGKGSFSLCESLTSINIPSSITSFENRQFDGSYLLRRLEIENLQFISKERIFMNEPILFSIEIPLNLKTINGKSIEKKDINEFIIPTTISEIDDWCFYKCNSLKSINIPTTISKLGNHCFSECSSLSEVILPTSIIKLGNYCFNNCSSLTSINIPSSITLFGECCFYGCGCTEELKKNKTIPRGSFEHTQ